MNQIIFNEILFIEFLFHGKPRLELNNLIYVEVFHEIKTQFSH